MRIGGNTMREPTERIVEILTETGDAEGPDGLDNPDLTNEDRASVAEKAAKSYASAAGFGRHFDANVESIVQDLINDLCHFMRARDLNVETVIAQAYLGFRTEEANEAEETTDDESEG